MDSFIFVSRKIRIFFAGFLNLLLQHLNANNNQLFFFLENAEIINTPEITSRNK
jgi:hypothetical protein